MERGHALLGAGGREPVVGFAQSVLLEQRVDVVVHEPAEPGHVEREDECERDCDHEAHPGPISSVLISAGSSANRRSDKCADHGAGTGDDRSDDRAHGTANGPTEAINGRPETLRGIALGFRNLDNYVTRSLLHTGGFRHTIQAHL